jgi:hypothetical protein
MFIKRIFLVFIGIFAVVPMFVYAQAIDSFSITAVPEFPKELQSTTISIESFSTDLQRSKITWKENGVVVAQETGLQSKTFSAPRSGASKSISVSVVTPSGIQITKEYVLAPQAIDILWEAPDTYVPPFYKGKALAGEQSIVRVVAIPNFTSRGAALDRTQTIYTWSTGGRQSEQGSGFNKSSFTFKFNPLKNSETVKVTAGTLSGDSQTQETLLLRPTQTEILFYEASPLLGTLYERVFTKGLRLITNEITLVAEPYYFSGAGSARSLTYAWTIAGAPVNPGSDQSRITLRNPGQAGQAEIKLSIRHIEKTLQNALRAITIVYDK